MLRRVADLPRHKMCRDREHNPPSHISLKPGIYEHRCPGCGKNTVFTVSGIFMNSKARYS